MKDADIYESAKERIGAVLPPPESSRAILAIIRLRRSTISGIDREAVDVLLATLERLAADLLEARLEIAAGLGQPEGGLLGWVWDGQNSRWMLRLSEDCWAWTHHCARDEDGWFWCSRGVTERYADTPRKAMRAAEEELRAGGLLP